MFIPYNTDAPLYHFPYATIGLIAVNAAAFAATVRDPKQAVSYTLWFGDGYHPVQWVTNNFLHADFMHLLGNMFFLWGFGLVVEGKLGWWRFLLLYFAIGAIYSVILQTAMLGAEFNVALGASGVLFGLLAIALVWAPKNEMSCFLWLIRPMLVDVPITAFAATYLVLQIVFASLSGFSMSSEMLHLTGMGVGAVFGVALLKLDVVDCEGWDIFAVWAGKEGQRPDPREEVAKRKAQAAASKPNAEEQSRFVENAIKTRLAAGDAAGAARLYLKQRDANRDWSLDQAALMALVKSLHAQQLWSESVRPMADYLRRFPENSIRVRLKLAQILTDLEHRPAKALRVLAKADRAALPADLRSIHSKLTAKAQQAQAESDFEVGDDEDW